MNKPTPTPTQRRGEAGQSGASGSQTPARTPNHALNEQGSASTDSELASGGRSVRGAKLRAQRAIHDQLAGPTRATRSTPGKRPRSSHAAGAAAGGEQAQGTGADGRRRALRANAEAAFGDDEEEAGDVGAGAGEAEEPAASGQAQGSGGAAFPASKQAQGSRRSPESLQPASPGAGGPSGADDNKGMRDGAGSGTCGICIAFHDCVRL